VPDARVLGGSLADCDKQQSGREDARLRALRAELLLRLGDARGKALALELWQGGYRDPAFAALVREHGIAANAAPMAPNVQAR